MKRFSATRRARIVSFEYPETAIQSRWAVGREVSGERQVGEWIGPLTAGQLRLRPGDLAGFEPLPLARHGGLPCVGGG
jgi:hypothetical protein